MKCCLCGRHKKLKQMDGTLCRCTVHHIINVSLCDADVNRISPYRNIVSLPHSVVTETSLIIENTNSLTLNMW